MSQYKYLALDAQQAETRGVLEADSLRQARTLLRDRGLQPLELKEQQAWQGLSLFKRSGRSALPQIIRQLATLVAAGIPLEEALRNLAGQKYSGYLRQSFNDLAKRLREGQSFATALSAHPEIFSELFIAMIAVGERTGSLDQVLIRLADYQERRRQIGMKVRLALIYPSLLILVSVLVVVGMMTLVVPRLVAQFESRDIALPLLTRIVMTVSDWLQQGWFLLPLIPLAGWLCWRFAGQAVRRQHRDRRCLGLPLLGRLWLLSDVARFARTLAITVASGIPLLDGLRVAIQTVTNDALRNALLLATEQVREGQPLGRSLLSSGLFPDVLVQMVASGERSGELTELLGKAADHQEQSLQDGISAALALLEPLLILLMGGMVFAIVLAVLLPVMQLNNFAGY